MSTEDEAEHEFRGTGGRQHFYRERDDPPNQVFQNLEERCKERLKGWERKSFEGKIQIEMEIAGYLRTMRDVLLQHGIELPGVDKFHSGGLKEVEGLYNREVLVGIIGDTRRLIAR